MNHDMKLPTNLSLNQVMEAVEADDNIGFCLSCGEMASGVEPDAHNYECEGCGEYKVYGAEEILVVFA